MVGRWGVEEEEEEEGTEIRPSAPSRRKKKNSKEKAKQELFSFKSHARNVRQLWPLCAEEKNNKNSPSLLKSVVYSFSFFFLFQSQSPVSGLGR